MNLSVQLTFIDLLIDCNSHLALENTQNRRYGYAI